METVGLGLFYEDLPVGRDRFGIAESFTAALTTRVLVSQCETAKQAQFKH